MMTDHKLTQNFLDNLYNILRNNYFKVIKTNKDNVIIKSPCDHEIKITKAPLYEKNKTLFKITSELEIPIYMPKALLENNTVLGQFVIIDSIKQLKEFLSLILNYIESVEDTQKIDAKKLTLHFNLFNVITMDEDVSSFLSSVSNQLQNEDNVQKILPFLDYIAIEKSIHSIISFNHGTNSIVTNRLIFSPVEKMFQDIYKDLFGRVRYVWDTSNNQLNDNYYYQSSYVDPQKYSYHEILDSKIWFERYIANKPNIVNLYSQIEL